MDAFPRPMAENPFYHSIQDGSALLSAISTQLDCLSDLAQLPLNAAERSTANRAVEAINAVLTGALEVVAAENSRWGLKSDV